MRTQGAPLRDDDDACVFCLDKPRKKAPRTALVVRRFLLWASLLLLPTFMAFVQFRRIKNLVRGGGNKEKKKKISLAAQEQQQIFDELNDNSKVNEELFEESNDSSKANEPVNEQWPEDVVNEQWPDDVVEPDVVVDNKACFLMSHDEYYRRRLADNKRGRIQEEHPGSKKLDKLRLGRCMYKYPTSVAPPGGYLHDIDYFHERDTHQNRVECFMSCIDELDDSERRNELLVQAAKMGLTPVVEKLHKYYGLDPLYSGGKPAAFNAIQQAIHGGHAEMVKVLLSQYDNKINLVIDSLGRTVQDYIRLKGSPIRPKDAANVLSLLRVTTTSDPQDILNRATAAATATVEFGYSGWNNKTSFPMDQHDGTDRCDIDVIYGDLGRQEFYRDYFTTGRPFVLRGAVPPQEIRAFQKSRWAETNRFHPTKARVRVGPTAYPSLTGQKHCSTLMSIAEIENATECNDLPGVPMVHARHPKEDDWYELYPDYDGDQYDKRTGWRKLADWFGSTPWRSHLGWQVFFGGDGSGATFHWHKAAMNVLYVGTKEWKLTPPKYRGWTGMPARSASAQLDDSVSLRCTQHPGDLMYIPDYWGHLTMNHGFSIGAAVILSPEFQQMASDKPGIHAKSKMMEKSKTTMANQKIFFVHINKTGGTSMIRMLKQRCRSQYISARWGDGHRTFHATAHALIDHFNRDSWNKAYNFALVRHPLGRQVSNFFFLIDLCSRHPSPSCRERLIPTDMDLNTLTDQQKIEAFHDYIWKLYQAYPPESPKHYLFGSRGHGNEAFETFNATQTSWLVDDKGKIVVENIFHLETLETDMSELADSIPCLKSEESESPDYNDRRLESTNEKDEEGRNLVEMIHENATPKYPDYKLFGRNERTNRIMKEVYAVDYKNFGYDFD